MVHLDLAGLKRRCGGRYGCLAELEVNSGRGSPAEDRFVATRIRVLDDPAYTPLVDQVVADCRSRYSAFLREQADAIDRAMDEARKKTPEARKLAGSRETTEQITLSWLPREERVRARFLTKISEGPSQTGKGTELKATRGPGGAAAPPAGSGRTTYGTTLVVEVGATFLVSRSGKFEEPEFHKPTSSTLNLPRPERSERRGGPGPPGGPAPPRGPR